jgi:hypothetical protein
MTRAAGARVPGGAAPAGTPAVTTQGMTGTDVRSLVHQHPAHPRPA